MVARIDNMHWQLKADSATTYHQHLMATEWNLHAFFNPRNSLNATELIAREQNATKGPNKDVYQACGRLFTAHLESADTVRIKGFHAPTLLLEIFNVVSININK